MGLDQYWLVDTEENQHFREFAHKTMERMYGSDTEQWPTDAAKRFDEVSRDCEAHEIYYHRKVGFLQQWMAEKWESLGNTTEFNCEYLTVSDEMLDELERDIEKAVINKDAAGFFWGSYHEGDMEDVQVAIAAARERLRDGDTVYYTAWY